MALIYGLFRVEHLGAQYAGLYAVRVISISLDGHRRTVCGVHWLVILVVCSVAVLDVSEAEAAGELALHAVCTYASAAKAIFGRLYISSKSHIVYKAEIRRENNLVSAIHDRDWYGLLRGKGAKLAPVATFTIFFLWVLRSASDHKMRCSRAA